MKQITKRKLTLKKVTICKLDNFEMRVAMAGICPPLSLYKEATCPNSGCPTTLVDPTKAESTVGC